MTPSEGKDSTAVTQEKHLLFLCFDLFCRFFWIFSFFPPCPTLPHPHCSCRFYWHYDIQLTFRAFFSPSVTLFIVVINICLYIGLLQLCGAFLLLSSFFLSSFLKNLFSFLQFYLLMFYTYYIFLHLFLYLPFLLFFSPCS